MISGAHPSAQWICSWWGFPVSYKNLPSWSHIKVSKGCVLPDVWGDGGLSYDPRSAGLQGCSKWLGQCLVWGWLVPSEKPVSRACSLLSASEAFVSPVPGHSHAQAPSQRFWKLRVCWGQWGPLPLLLHLPW